METAAGMSITFTAVMVISAALSWVIYKAIMIPLNLTFLKIVIFIGIVAGFVQAADTIMRKVTRTLLQTRHLPCPDNNQLHNPCSTADKRRRELTASAEPFLCPRLRYRLCSGTYNNGEHQGAA